MESYARIALRIMQNKNLNDIAVIIVVYKYPKNALDDLLRAVQRFGINKKSIFVRDNTNDNVGYAAGINSILRKILKNYKAFLILNPDITISKKTVEILWGSLFEREKIGIVGPKILDENGYIWSMGGEIDEKRYSGGGREIGKNYVKTRMPFEVDFIPGTAMLIKKEVFQKIGLLKEDYFIYYEDVDFSLRAKRAGFDLIVVPQAEIIHRASSTVGKESPAMNYYMARNHLMLVKRFAPFSIKIRELIRMPKTLYNARNSRYELKGIIDFFGGRFGRSIEIKNSVDL